MEEKNGKDLEKWSMFYYLAQCICIWSKNFDFCVFLSLLLYVFGIMMMGVFLMDKFLNSLIEYILIHHLSIMFLFILDIFVLIRYYIDVKKYLYFT